MKYLLMVTIGLMLNSGLALAQTVVKTTTSTDKQGNVTSTATTEQPGMHSEVTITQTKEENERNGKAMVELMSAITECKPFQNSIPHPMIPGESVKSQVHGLAGDKCKFTQTMPNNGLLSCLFTGEQRSQIKKDAKNYNTFMMDEKVCQITGY